MPWFDAVISHISPQKPFFDVKRTDEYPRKFGDPDIQQFRLNFRHTELSLVCLNLYVNREVGRLTPRRGLGRKPW
jgi:hypothetical protein